MPKHKPAVLKKEAIENAYRIPGDVENELRRMTQEFIQTHRCIVSRDISLDTDTESIAQ